MSKKKVYIKAYKQEKSHSSILDFDGTNDHILINYNSALNPTAMSVSAWIYPEAFSSLASSVVSLWSDTPLQRIYLLQLTSTGALQVAITGTGGLISPSSTATIPLNTWTHIAFTYSSTDGLKGYINGARALTNSAVGTITTGTRQIDIGWRNDSAVDTQFNGKIAEVCIWNTVLTVNEIMEIKNKTLLNSGGTGIRTDISTTGLVAYYPLNEGTGTTATDYKGGYNGTLTNFTGTYWLTTGLPPVYDRVFKGFFTDFGFSSFVIPQKLDEPFLGDTYSEALKNVELSVIAYDNEGSNTLYTGEVYDITGESGDSENLSVSCYGIASRLKKTPFVSITGSYEVAYSSTELAQILRDVIAIYNSQHNTGIIKYTSSTLANTGTTTTITFNNANCLDVINTIIKKTPDDYFWYIDNDGTFYLKQISTTFDHLLLFGGDVQRISIRHTKDKVVNELLIWDGDTVKRRYIDETSQDDYGKVVEWMRDGRLSADGMDKEATRRFAMESQPIKEVKFTIADSNYGAGYDIDSIKVGDVVKITNLDTDSDIPDSLIIYQKNDYLDYAEFVATDVRDFIQRVLADLKDEQFVVNYESGPTTYTLV
jgi:hypothetical protein